jgi:outer membrane lipoprotein carrier protein
LFVVAGLCGLLDATLHAQTIESLLERLQQKYESIEGLRAEFTQTVTSAFDEGEPASVSGTILLSGDWYRIEVEGMINVTDGKTSWVYLPDENQMMISDMVEDETAMSPSDFFSEFDDTYEATVAGSERIGGARHFVIKLHPKTAESFILEATVWMRDRDDIVTQMELTNVDDTTMFFRMDNIEMNIPIDPDAFVLTPPEGAEINDLRDQ